MGELRFLTSGESHGPALVGVIEGLPAGLSLSSGDINRDLRRRQKGYGRGGRMRLEHDRAEILGGIVGGVTVGSPVALRIENRGRKTGSPSRIPVPRPGHADLAGVLKYRFADAHPVAERASARETAMRVAVGAVARKLLAEIGIDILSCTTTIGTVSSPPMSPPLTLALHRRVERSPVRCPHTASSRRMCEQIDAVRESGDTLGGSSLVMAEGVPPGLGSYVHWDRRLDARLAAALMSIPSAKVVEVGDGLETSRSRGSVAHDPILPGEKSAGRAPRGAAVSRRVPAFHRPSNRAGGLEGGVTNGEPLLLRVYFKPISTLRAALPSVDLASGRRAPAPYRRSDVCVVPAAGVIAEAMVAWVLAGAVMEKFGGDSMIELKAFWNVWQEGNRRRT